MRARILITPFLALLALALVGCSGERASTLPALELVSITPDEVTADAALLTLTGAYFFQAGNGSSMRVEACGVTTTATIVDPLTRAILLPPAGKIVVQAGDRLTAELPSEGLMPGVSDVRVTRPDGGSAVLEGALTCVAAADPDPEDPEEPEDDPTLGKLSVTLSPAIPATITITGPEGYAETVTGARDLRNLAPGEYRLTTAETNELVEQSYGGSTYSFERIWTPTQLETTVQVEADDTAAVSISFDLAPTSLDVSVAGLPSDYDPGHWALELVIERLQGDETTWAAVDLKDLMSVAPGVYRARAADVTRRDEVAWNYFEERYDLSDDGGLVAADSGSSASLELTYELVPSSIAVASIGLPAGLEQDYYVELRYNGPPYWGPPLYAATDLDPGAYYLQSPEQRTTVEIPHPEGGTVDLGHLYRADAIAFTLDSGEHLNLAPEYELEPALLRVNISGYEGDPDAVGNVRFRRVGGAGWTTVTTQGMKLFYGEPGIYEVESFNVPAEPGVHKGYYRQAYSSQRYYQVDSYGYDGANMVDISVTYREYP